MFFLALPALPVLLEVIVTAAVATFATKAASDVYDHLKGGDDAAAKNAGAARRAP